MVNTKHVFLVLWIREILPVKFTSSLRELLHLFAATAPPSPKYKVEVVFQGVMVLADKYCQSTLYVGEGGPC